MPSLHLKLHLWLTLKMKIQYTTQQARFVFPSLRDQSHYPWVIQRRMSLAWHKNGHFPSNYCSKLCLILVWLIFRPHLFVYFPYNSLLPPHSLLHHILNQIFFFFFNCLFLFFNFIFWPCRAACGILAPQPGIEPVSPVLEARISTTGPPEKSLSQSS